MYPTLGPRPAPPKRGLKAWHWIALGAIALSTFCLLTTALVGAVKGPGKPAIQPIATASGQPAQAPPSSYVVPAIPVPQGITVSGKNNAVVQVGAVLNGRFNVEYSFGSWCGIASFLKADGSEGAGFMETINDCSGNPDGKLSGSTIVNLKNVTMVKTDNTRGAWSLKLTPISV